jgi:hypothetical protein
MKLSYAQFLADNNIPESELPEHITAAIAKLHELEYDLEDSDIDQEVAQITAELRTIDRQITKAIEDWFDDESSEDLPAETIKGEILQQFYQAGLRKLTAAQLAKAGYQVQKGNKWAEKVGGYRLEKTLYNDFIQLSKV